MMIGPARSWSVKIAPAGRKAQLTFVSPEGKDVPFETQIGLAELKVFLKHIGQSNVPIGKSAPTLTIPGIDENVLLDQKVRGDVLKLINNYRLRLTAPAPILQAPGRKLVTHGAAVALLTGLVPTKRGTGHPSIKFAGIVLPRAYTLWVAAREHPITHLYTQVIEQREVRCYLGNAEGAYQRVHTSLTDDDSAHTMVQICPVVIIPGYNDHRTMGQRTGFDLFGSSLLLSQKPLQPRSKAQCTVKGSIDGLHASELHPRMKTACELMARSFNEVLEAVLLDLLHASNVTATFIGPSFVILDAVWVLPNGKQETPDDYYDAYEVRRTSARAERLRFKQTKAKLFKAALSPESSYEDSLRYRRLAASELPEI